MHYIAEVTVDLPRDDVLWLLADRESDELWRPDLAMCEPITGEPGWPGAQTRLIYRHMGGGSRERMEHIVANRLPDALELSLVSPNMTEHQTYSFSVVGQSATRWTIESNVEFRHSGFALRRHSSLLESETQRAMDAFKSFAEGPSGRAKIASRSSKRGRDPRIHFHSRI